MKTLRETNFAPHVERGKVRDIYTGRNDRLVHVTTDRISCFDVVLRQQVPYKGQGLNFSSAYTFQNSADIIPNHFIVMPHPNVMIVRRCKPYPVEVVVRGYLSGSAWRKYEKGERRFFDTTLPHGLRRNQNLLEVLDGNPLHTPTTKAKTGHDVDITPKEVIELVGKYPWEYMKSIGTKLFLRANEWAARNGYVEADTKYEFGEFDSETVLIDEGNTHDSSRFFRTDSYQERFERGEDLDWIDKEFVRNYLKSIGFMGDGEIPDLPEWVVEGASQRVIESVHALTGSTFTPVEPNEDKIRETVYWWLKR